MSTKTEEMLCKSAFAKLGHNLMCAESDMILSVALEASRGCFWVTQGPTTHSVDDFGAQNANQK